MGSNQGKQKYQENKDKDEKYAEELPQYSEFYILIALYDFNAMSETQLTIKKGEYLRLLGFSRDGNWSEVESLTSHCRGWIPANYVSKIDILNQKDVSIQPPGHDQLMLFSWYHGNISRQEGEHLLRSGINGSFLVRASESQPGQLSVTLRYEGRVYHYRISFDTEKKLYYITENHKFARVSLLIEHHSKFPDGLICGLLYPVTRKIRSFNTNEIGTNSIDYSIKSSNHIKNFEEVESWEIDRSEILMHHKLGGGQYGDVYEAVWKRYNIVVAVKTLKEELNLKIDDFLKEAIIMKSLKHKNLVQLFGVCSKEPPFYMITEYISKGNLLEFLRNCNPLEVTPIVLIYMATQIAAGMSYLEENNFIHRDLAARNCLVGDKYLIKIGDFGLARCIHRDDSYTAKIGAKFPIKWTAPESLAFNKFSTKSDVWAFGVVLWELATYGLSPYPGIELHEVYHILEKGFRMDRPEGCPEIVYGLMLQCWQWDPQSRPSFKHLHAKFQLLCFSHHSVNKLDFQPYDIDPFFKHKRNEMHKSYQNVSSSKTKEPHEIKEAAFSPGRSRILKHSVNELLKSNSKSKTDVEESTPDESGVGESVLSCESVTGSLAQQSCTHKSGSCICFNNPSIRTNYMNNPRYYSNPSSCKGEFSVLGNSIRKLMLNESIGQFSTIPPRDRIDMYLDSLYEYKDDNINHKTVGLNHSEMIKHDTDDDGVESNTEDIVPIADNSSLLSDSPASSSRNDNREIYSRLNHDVDLNQQHQSSQQKFRTAFKDLKISKESVNDYLNSIIFQTDFILDSYPKMKPDLNQYLAQLKLCQYYIEPFLQTTVANSNQNEILQALTSISCLNDKLNYFSDSPDIVRINDIFKSIQEELKVIKHYISLLFNLD